LPHKEIAELLVDLASGATTSHRRKMVVYDGSGTVFDESKPVQYAGGWQPEPLTKPKPIDPDNPPPPSHAKINRYHVVRNTSEYYTFQIETLVVKEDDITKAEWSANTEEIAEMSVTMEDGGMVLRKKDDEWGAFFKLPKGADPTCEPIVCKPKRGGLFVTVMRHGVRMTPPPLDDRMTGDGPKKYYKDGVEVEPDQLFKKD